ncbi:ComF family protein [Roseospira marina]|uniref:ComF family protein n=1 Tax=Roseospira marina TaxID=140057 RepID=A0A5M6IFI0_9PROT|nr:ComF family protein [Roseospira marina]KAA5607040.1 ComF family protein [Roseospira marina]MBB4312773.1 ComF family protein [Roseospira marina]MBB5086454.1 ComF family protein [Roseospira marina]
MKDPSRLDRGLRRHGRTVAAWLRPALDLVLPPRCLRCGDLVADPGALCSPCFQAATFITAPVCARCGVPFGGDWGAPVDEDATGLLCAACARRPPPYHRARAALVYDDGARPLILAFKHGDRTDAAGALAGWMARAGAPLLESADLIVPVPLHRWRLWQRRYNQAGLLARALAAHSRRPWSPDVLTRIRATPTQGGKGRRDRAANVRHVFRVARPIRIAGQRVLLIDDVMTTGATVEACTRALRQAGAVAVDVLTLARVLETETDAPLSE